MVVLEGWLFSQFRVLVRALKGCFRGCRVLTRQAGVAACARAAHGAPAVVGQAVGLAAAHHAREQLRRLHRVAVPQVGRVLRRRTVSSPLRPQTVVLSLASQTAGCDAHHSGQTHLYKATKQVHWVALPDRDTWRGGNQKVLPHSGVPAPRPTPAQCLPGPAPCCSWFAGGWHAGGMS